MKTSNPFIKIREFSNIVDNPMNLSILLSIAKKSRRTYDQLIVDFNGDVKNVVDSIDTLQKSNLIEGNPNPLSKKFKLSFNGQLFAEQLKIEFPNVKDFLGNDSLIEPLHI